MIRFSGLGVWFKSTPMMIQEISDITEEVPHSSNDYFVIYSAFGGKEPKRLP